MIHRTWIQFRKVHVTIPKLSPTHTRAKIVQWCQDWNNRPKSYYLESYDPLFILQCSPDMVTEGYRESPHHEPIMIVEAHDEGIFTLNDGIEMHQWYKVGTIIGTIDDGDDDDDEDDDDDDKKKDQTDTNHDAEWLWQAYAHTMEETMVK